jgi:hypothetical protein
LDIFRLAGRFTQESLETALSDLRHLLVLEPSPGRHPLDVPGSHFARVSHRVVVAHDALEHVRHRFDPAMRMHGEAGDVLVGIVRPEVVEQQERVEIIEHRRRDAPPKAHPRAVHRLHRVDDPFDLPGVLRHVVLPFTLHSSKQNRIPGYGANSGALTPMCYM